MNKNELFRQIPKMNDILENFSGNTHNRQIIKFCAENVLENLREKIAKGEVNTVEDNRILQDIESAHDRFITGSLNKVINATGIIIHTNLGRSPISTEIFRKSEDTACGYSNLEYDLKEGERGDRYHHLREYLKYLTGAEDAVILNNNAAAVFLILNTFAKNRGCIVSRGELVEIGGSFRIPEVMKNSGAILQEIGTTNKTKAADYEKAITHETSVIMKVHKSNYVIEGFTEESSLEEITQIAGENGLISYYDLGSGSINNFGIEFCNEFTVKDVISKNFDLVSFSGDKLLGGVQSGIVVGRKHLIQQIKKNQLMRMLRVDKVTLSLLQNTLREYVAGNYENILSLSMFSENLTSLKSRAEKLAEIIRRYSPGMNVNVAKVTTYTGGGSCPMQEIDSYAVQIDTGNLDENIIEENLRKFKTPIICRITGKKILFDIRTISEKDYEEIAGGLHWAVEMS